MYLESSRTVLYPIRSSSGPYLNCHHCVMIVYEGLLSWSNINLVAARNICDCHPSEGCAGLSACVRVKLKAKVLKADSRTLIQVCVSRNIVAVRFAENHRDP